MTSYLPEKIICPYKKLIRAKTRANKYKSIREMPEMSVKSRDCVDAVG